MSGSLWAAFGTGLYLGFFGAAIFYTAVADWSERRARRVKARARRMR